MLFLLSVLHLNRLYYFSHRMQPTPEVCGGYMGVYTLYPLNFLKKQLISYVPYESYSIYIQGYTLWLQRKPSVFSTTTSLANTPYSQNLYTDSRWSITKSYFSLPSYEFTQAHTSKLNFLLLSKILKIIFDIQ